MTPFRFRLQRVLQWQLKVCRLEEEKVRTCLSAVAESAEKLAQLQADTIGVEQELALHLVFSATELNARAQFRIQAVDGEKRLIAVKLARSRELDEQRGKLMAERHRLRLLEKLRERAVTEHRKLADQELEALALESHLCGSSSLKATRTNP